MIVYSLKLPVYLWMFACISLFSHIAHAESDSFLNAAEIHVLMAGNSMSGKYDGKDFKQNNRADGVAIVHIDGQKIQHISWIVNDNDENWKEWGWSCFKLKKLDNNKVIAVKRRVQAHEQYQWQCSNGFINLNP
ncbi:MAG: hypothetical protein ACKVJE_08040 [Pseudomonadales bacterium]